MTEKQTASALVTDIEARIANAEKSLRDAYEARDIAEKLTDIPSPLAAYVFFDKIIMSIRKLADLHVAREYLRNALGCWEDKLTHIYAGYSDQATAEWHSEEVPIEIRLTVPIADFPKELMGPNCRFVAAESAEPTPRYRYVCNAETGESDD